jgi:hypothetical protein
MPNITLEYLKFSNYFLINRNHTSLGDFLHCLKKQYNSYLNFFKTSYSMFGNPGKSNLSGEDSTEISHREEQSYG